MSHLLIQTFSSILEASPVGADEVCISAKVKYKLAPPYLCKLPGELVQHEKEYSGRAFSIPTKLTFHFLWITFRVSYFLGWRKALRTSLMPHRNFSRKSFSNKVLCHSK